MNAEEKEESHINLHKATGENLSAISALLQEVAKDHFEFKAFQYKKNDLIGNVFKAGREVNVQAKNYIFGLEDEVNALRERIAALENNAA